MSTNRSYQNCRRLMELKSKLSKAPPVECGFKLGDIVTFTNDQGGVFPDQTIIGFETKEQYEWNTEQRYLPGRFIYLDYDCFWFPAKPENLTLEKSAA